MAFAYQIVVDQLLTRIRSGEWREGDQIPSLAELEKTFPQSRMTLYKALQHLVDQGYLTMTRGSGTFVRATRTRRRIAVLTGGNVFDHGIVPFAVAAFRHAHACFAKFGMDAQLYTEDARTESSLPAGLEEEFTRRKLAGLLTVTAGFSWRISDSVLWKSYSVPLVNLGPGPVLHSFDVDRDAFLEQAIRLAKQNGRRRVALLERHEHLGEHAARFAKMCDEAGIKFCPPPPDMPSSELSYEEYGYELMQRVWSLSPRPDAIIVPDDVLAKGVSQGASALGIKVPRSLLIIAMTNRGSRLFYPAPIVPFEVDVESMVQSATRTLIDLINGIDVAPCTQLVSPVLAARAQFFEIEAASRNTGRNRR